MINCPTYWDERHPTTRDFPLNILSTPSAPSRVRNLSPSFIQDVLDYYRSDPRYQGHRRQQQPVSWFQRRSPRSITLDNLDSIEQPPELRQLVYAETVFPRWNPPDAHMDESDNLTWHRHFGERLLVHEHTAASDDEVQVTVMSDEEHLDFLIQNGAVARSSRSSRLER